MEQLPLGVRLQSASTFDSFDVGDNAPLVAALEARASGAHLPPLWLWSSAGLGRTHLLQAVCQRASRAGRRVGYLPLSEAWVTAEMLQGLEALEVVCLDDIDVVAGAADWDRRLFILYNELAERGHHLVMSASVAPGALSVALPDLASRLTASVVWAVKPLPEDRQGVAIQRRAEALGLELSDEVLNFLLRRLPRDLAALCRALDRLDRAALARQRRLTVPFVSSVLEELLD
jgi:DnaA family protein